MEKFEKIITLLKEGKGNAYDLVEYFDMVNEAIGNATSRKEASKREIMGYYLQELETGVEFTNEKSLEEVESHYKLWIEEEDLYRALRVKMLEELDITEEKLAETRGDIPF